MNTSSIHDTNFDPIALETKHQGDFERTAKRISSRSLAEKEFSKNYKDRRPASFADGKYDGELNLEPEPIGYADSPLP